MNAEWAGVTLKNLLSETRQKKGRISKLLKTSDNLREKLRLSDHTRLLAVLNGEEYQLESFWGMERKNLYRHLSDLEFSGVTGPTFSITSEFDANPITPASHNVLMLQRHHQVVAELIHRTNATVIPNLYWRTNRDRKRWIEWLSSNPQVAVISRDFSITKTGTSFRREFEGLLQIVEPIKRPLHVLLPGIGTSNAGFCIRRLAAHGCTGSIVTGDPILKAVTGGKRLVQHGDNLKESTGDNTGRRHLAHYNLETMRDYLLKIASGLSVYSGSEANHNDNRGSHNQLSGFTSPDVTNKKLIPSHNQGSRPARTDAA